jgi:hypothetical protein
MYNMVIFLKSNLNLNAIHMHNLTGFVHTPLNSGLELIYCTRLLIQLCEYGVVTMLGRSGSPVAKCASSLHVVLAE